MKHLILNLELPLAAFGGAAIDNYRFTDLFPGASMLAGLLANALGWERTEPAQTQDLQDRLAFAVRIDREPAQGAPLTDFHTARLSADDRGWTTGGAPEGRPGSPDTYQSPHLRYREYHCDLRATVALRLDLPGKEPTLDDLAAALDRPARPLFVGRKACLPAARLFAGFAEGDTALDALLSVPLDQSTATPVRALWTAGQGVERVPHEQETLRHDRRNWLLGAHAGGAIAQTARIEPAEFATPPEPEPEEEPVLAQPAPRRQRRNPAPDEPRPQRQQRQPDQPLLMIKGSVSPADFSRWRESRGLRDPDHAMHCLLTEMFGADAPYPFRVIMPHARNAPGTLYGYATVTPDALMEAADINSDPAQYRIIPPDTLEDKPMPDQWRAGQRVGFEVRIKPIVRPGRNTAFRNLEMDAFIYAVRRNDDPTRAINREQVYASWLERKLERHGGARLEYATMRAFRRVKSQPRPGRQEHEGPDAVMRGELTVTDSDAFNRLLARGVGRHRAYGYGMLLLRPSGRTISRQDGEATY